MSGGKDKKVDDKKAIDKHPSVGDHSGNKNTEVPPIYDQRAMNKHTNRECNNNYGNDSQGLIVKAPTSSSAKAPTTAKTPAKVCEKHIEDHSGNKNTKVRPIKDTRTMNDHENNGCNNNYGNRSYGSINL